MPRSLRDLLCIAATRHDTLHQFLEHYTSTDHDPTREQDFLVRVLRCDRLFTGQCNDPMHARSCLHFGVDAPDGEIFVLASYSSYDHASMGTQCMVCRIWQVTGPYRFTGVDVSNHDFTYTADMWREIELSSGVALSHK